MKKVFTILVLMFNISVSVYSQTVKTDMKECGFSLAVNYFAYLPTGSFANKSSSINNAGFSNPGIGLSLNASKKISGKVALIGEFSLSANSIDAGAINQYFQNFYSIKSTTNTTNWRFINYMFGGYYTFFEKKNVDKSIELYNRILFGLCNSRSPEIMVSGFDNASNQISIQQSSGSGNSFAYQLGIGVKFISKKRVYFGAGIDYFFTNAKVSNVDIAKTQNSSVTKSSIAFSQTVATFPFIATLGIRL